MNSEKKISLTDKQSEPKRLRKLYYKIGEVCEITDLPHHVIRFWEREFPQLSPRKTNTGHRIFSEKDIQIILLIKDLLYTKKFTIKGAREYIANKGGEEISAEKPSRKSNSECISLLVEGLKKIKQLLERKPPN